MKQLTLAEMQHISGGDYDFTFALHVPTSENWQTMGLLEQMLLGGVVDSNGFAQAITNPNASFTNFRFISFQFDNFS